MHDRERGPMVGPVLLGVKAGDVTVSNSGQGRFYLQQWVGAWDLQSSKVYKCQRGQFNRLCRDGFVVIVWTVQSSPVNGRILWHA